MSYSALLMYGVGGALPMYALFWLLLRNRHLRARPRWFALVIAWAVVVALGLYGLESMSAVAVITAYTVSAAVVGLVDSWISRRGPGMA